LKARSAKFGLEVAADKTKTLRFGQHGGPHNGRFDFLGFEFHWGTDRKGRPNVKRRTATKKHLAAVQRMKDWIKEQRDEACFAGHMRERVDLKSPVRENRRRDL
jgi:RNA-directed DNA polymerase